MCCKWHLMFLGFFNQELSQNSETMCEKLSTPHDLVACETNFSGNNFASLLFKTLLQFILLRSHHSIKSSILFIFLYIVYCLAYFRSLSCFVTQFIVVRWPHILLENTFLYRRIRGWLSDCKVSRSSGCKTATIFDIWHFWYEVFALICCVGFLLNMALRIMTKHIHLSCGKSYGLFRW